MTIISDIALPAALFSLMFALGLSLTKGDFVEVIRSYRVVLVSMASLLLLVPLIGFAVAVVAAPSPWLAVGIVLVAACPGGTFSNLLTSFAKGDLALSISLTTLTSLLAVFTLPFYVSLALDVFVAQSQAITLPLGETIIKISMLTILPVALGMSAKRYLPSCAARLENRLKNIAAAAIIVTFTAIMVDQRHDFYEAIRQVALPILILNLSCVLAGFVITRVFRLSRRQTNAVVIEHTIKQEGSGIYIAVAILGVPMAALPLLTNTVIGLMVGGVITFVAARLAAGRADYVQESGHA